MKFVTSKELTKCIKKVMGAAKPRMCVAFLGPNWTDEIFESGVPNDLKVICDLRMRGTTRKALEAGGAPENAHLKHMPKVEMHAKVYLSEVGAIVCSANASESALSSEARIEDGIWVEPGTEAYLEVEKEFEHRYKRAQMIDEAALNDAPERLIVAAELESNASKTLEDRKLFELVRLDPNLLSGIRFIFSEQDVNAATKVEADRQLDQEIDDGAVTESLRSREYFSGWKRKESEWPALFFSIYRGRGGRILLTKNRHFCFIDDANNEEVFVAHHVDWRSNGAAFGDLPRLAKHSECLNELKTIFPKSEAFEPFAGKILTAHEVAELLLNSN